MGRNKIDASHLQHEDTPEAALTSEDIALMSEIAKGVTTEVAARNLNLSARTLRRMVRSICDQLEVDTPIEAVVHLASRRILPSPSPKIRPNLTPEEIDLLVEIATGATTEAAARHLGLDTGTLRRRIRRICDTLGVDAPIQAVVWAARHKLI